MWMWKGGGGREGREPRAGAEFANRRLQKRAEPTQLFLGPN